MLYNLSVMESIGDNDPIFINTLVYVFIESIPADLENLNNASRDHDWTQVSFMAHKIKSTIDNLGIDSLKEIIRLLEANSIINSLSVDDLFCYVNEVNDVMCEVVSEMLENYPEVL